MKVCSKCVILTYLAVLYSQTGLHIPRLTLFIPNGHRWNFQWLFHPAKGLIPQGAPAIIFLAAAFSGGISLASRKSCHSSSRWCWWDSQVSITVPHTSRRNTTNLVIFEDTCPEQVLCLQICGNDSYLETRNSRRKTTIKGCIGTDDDLLYRQIISVCVSSFNDNPSLHHSPCPRSKISSKAVSVDRLGNKSLVFTPTRRIEVCKAIMTFSVKVIEIFSQTEKKNPYTSG